VALQLVVHALRYISAYPDDIAAVWPAGTPESLREKTEHGKGKEIARAKSKLTALSLKRPLLNHSYSGPSRRVPARHPVGHFKFPHPWPDQIPPGRTVGL
jgi:hypothetical protein